METGPILDVFDADLGRDVNMAGTILGDVDNTGYGYYMGYNAVTGSYDASKMSFGPRKGNRQLVSQICLLRNVTSLTQSITDDRRERTPGPPETWADAERPTTMPLLEAIPPFSTTPAGMAASPGKGILRER